MRQREEADDSRAHDGAVSHSTVHVLEACGLIYPLAYLSQVSRAPKPVALAVHVFIIIYYGRTTV